MLTEIKTKVYLWRYRRAKAFPAFKSNLLSIIDNEGVRLSVDNLETVLEGVKNNQGLSDEERADLVVAVRARINNHPMTRLMKRLRDI